MTTAEQASEQGRFAAREFLAEYERRTGTKPPPEFAFEMGYLRGRADAAEAFTAMLEGKKAGG